MKCVLSALLFLTSVALAVPDWQPVDQPWPRALGTHRVIVRVAELPQGTPVVGAHLEWRRPDRDPEKKAVIVQELKSGKVVHNVRVDLLNNVEGNLVFEPTCGLGEYAVYFLPAEIGGGAFPVGKYLAPSSAADESWLRGAAQAPAAAASVVRWEAISAQDAWTEMEVIATSGETKAMMESWPQGVALFVPGKGKSVRMPDRVSYLMAASARPGTVSLGARPGEALVFPIVLWSPERDLEQVKISFTSSGAPQSGWVDPKNIQCLSTEQTDWNGKTSLVPLTVAKGQVKPVWFSLAMPAQPGSQVFSVEVTAGGNSNKLSGLQLEISAAGLLLGDHGDSDPRSLSRLRWLNSTTAVDDEPVKGYPPLTLHGRTIRCLGRELELGEDGLPVQVRSFYNQAVTRILPQATLELLQAPVQFSLQPAEGPATAMQGSGFAITRQSPGVISWTSQWQGGGARALLSGSMEFDGSVHYRIALSAGDTALRVKQAGLKVGRTAATSGYLLGLQQETGRNPGSFDWRWDVAEKNQDSVWLGAVNGGLRLQLRSDNYIRPSVNIHYKRRPLNDPPSWNAGGTGGMTLRSSGAGSTLDCLSGAFTLEPGQPLHFDFDLLITPFHPLRTAEQWTDRYYHTGQVPADFNKYLDGAKTNGANIINIHQGNSLNPYINYPFLTWEKLRAFSDAAHQRGMRAKYYYTVRELSNWCPELFAFRSMGNEILMSGKGGGHPWGEEHLAGDYWQAWYEPTVQDVSFLTQPMSRFHNYYIEGLRWLCENAGCDGIYLDDIAYDRAIMLRARKVLDRYSPRGGLIDLHSWNEFHEGGAWAHCPNIFMDSMPFVDRLWFGEGHHYSGPPPEHFLVELSGIPFGLMGEMLEGGGNPWLGLVHGCTGRLGWGGEPREVWQLWDDFGVRDAEFIGWWAGQECPVRSADPMVKATVWKKPQATLVAVANFSKDPKAAALQIDWAALGRDPARAKFYFPPLVGMKQLAALRSADQMPLLKPYAGVVFIIDEADHPIEAAAAPQALGAVLMEDDFSKGLGKSWTPVLSPQAPAAGKLDHGYVLAMPANRYGYLERSLPDQAGAVGARLWQDGQDEAQQWGPGLALVWPDGTTLRTNLRKDGRVSVFGGGVDRMDTTIQTRAPVELTIRWDRTSVSVTASGPAMGDLPVEVARLPRSQFPGQPALLRVGKMPNDASPRDFPEAGLPGFNRIEWVRVHR